MALQLRNGTDLLNIASIASSIQNDNNFNNHNIIVLVFYSS